MGLKENRRIDELESRIRRLGEGLEKLTDVVGRLSEGRLDMLQSKPAPKPEKKTTSKK